MPDNFTYMDFVSTVAQADVAGLREKDAEYGGSWKARGGVGAFMMLARKWDRLENHVRQQARAYDIFDAIENDPRKEGVLDDIRDLRRYLMLVEAEILARGSKTSDELNPHPHNGTIGPTTDTSKPIEIIGTEDLTGQRTPFGFNPNDADHERLVPRR